MTQLFHQLKVIKPDFQPKSILDFGCGPGIGLWAAKQAWPINKALAIDINQHMLNIVEEWANTPSSDFQFEQLETMAYQRMQTEFEAKDQLDLVVSAFTLSDLPNDAHRKSTVENLWKQTKDVLVLVERGTLVGSQTILEARKRLIEFSSNRKWPIHIVGPVIYSHVVSS